MFLDDLKASVFPGSSRKALKEFLYSQKEIRGKLVRAIAVCELRNIHQCLGKGGDPSQEEVHGYVLQHFQEIDGKVRKVLEDTARRALPGLAPVVIFKHIGLFALCLVPALHVLVKMALGSTCAALTEECVFAILLIAILLISSGAALIRSAMNSDK